MPSGHFLGALLMYWFSRQCRWQVHVGFAVFTALTALATVGLGEHYLVDLIAAIPFAAAIYYSVHLRIPRALRISGGAK